MTREGVAMEGKPAGYILTALLMELFCKGNGVHSVTSTSLQGETYAYMLHAWGNTLRIFWVERPPVSSPTKEKKKFNLQTVLWELLK